MVEFVPVTGPVAPIPASLVREKRRTSGSPADAVLPSARKNELTTRTFRKSGLIGVGRGDGAGVGLALVLYA